MDKYEFNIKVDQIKKLAAKKSFQEAAAIAKEMNWQKVKDWSTLATVINRGLSGSKRYGNSCIQQKFRRQKAGL